MKKVQYEKVANSSFREVSNECGKNQAEDSTPLACATATDGEADLFIFACNMTELTSTDVTETIIETLSVTVKMFQSSSIE